MLMSLKLFTKAAVCAAFAVALCQVCLAQASITADKPMAPASVEPQSASLPNVTQIDIEGLKPLLKPHGRPLLINFWATWCDPCREEFPELVRIDAEYHGKIDLITISLDELADIRTYVPKFLADMKSEMPAYLLHTPDESAAISLVSKNWSGNLPMTVLFDGDGKAAYSRNGKVRYEAVKAEIDKLLKPSTTGNAQIPKN